MPEEGQAAVAAWGESGEQLGEQLRVGQLLLQPPGELLLHCGALRRSSVSVLFLDLRLATQNIMISIVDLWMADFEFQVFFFIIF